MQTVPSLVGTGTATAAATSGLAFGEAVEPDDLIVGRAGTRPAMRRENDEPTIRTRLSNLSSSRPGTSSAAPSITVEAPQHNTVSQPPVVSRPPLSRYQRPRTSQLTSPRAPSRRQSVSRHGESSFNTISETPRASISSSGSWIRRLSIRPSSQHGSPRSSIGPDSSSIAFSHGSGAPILSPSHPAAPPPTPNKLVKRTPSTSNDDPLAARPRSKSHRPSLRRPATSHQRSVDLQQELQANLGLDTPAAPSQNSSDRGSLLPSPFERDYKPRKGSGWASFFHSRISSIGGRGAGRVTDSSPQSRHSTPRRVLIFSSDHRQRAQLIRPEMVSTTSAPAAETSVSTDIQEEPGQQSEEAHNGGPAVNPPTGRTRRSLSMSLSSAGNWVSRTSGSLRRPKSRASPKNETNRHVSEPLMTSEVLAERRTNATQRVPMAAPNPHTTRQGSALTPATNAQDPSQKRTPSSPLAPHSSFSSFNVDLSRSGPSGGASTQNLRQNQPSGSSVSSTAMSQFRAHERTSTMDGSESEPRGFTSGDDEDTDFKSDTVFDSIRTGTSGRARAVETPLDSMYDESPPSTGGNGKTKRLSIQEILGKDWDGGNKILEEDENTHTPVRTTQEHTVPFCGGLSAEPRLSTESDFSTKEIGRFSADDDFDDDWARDDDAPYNALSPPSKGSSINSGGVNPNIRVALASVSGNTVAETNASDNCSERPLSNIFDWSEPSVHETKEANGRSLRPKTAYANQVDARGGRSSTRLGPNPTHLRSQSVPVVHEVPDEAKPAGSKYGTWAMGTKTISEDWDDDFEFGGSVGNDDKSNELLFAVPESIQATQPSVRAHSGQIRELSLLVNDLQRLCRHGRNLDLLDGSQKSLWKEAEGIIALASPDDDSVEAGHETSSSIDLDAFDANDRSPDDGFDSASLDRLDAALDGREPAMSKTAVVRDRPSPRRRSVFSPDDDIFGGQRPLADDNVQSNRSSRPRTPESRLNKSPDVNGVVRSVVEVMQQRSIPGPSLEGENASKKMHFDTNSLKILVKRASDLRDILSDLVRRVDQITSSPARSARHERQLESSPAFTKVFDEPAASPPRRVMRSRGNTSIVDDVSPENSPSSGVSRRMQIMKVK